MREFATARMKLSDLVFVGKVTESSVNEPGPEKNPVTFDVGRVYKGQPSTRITVEFGLGTYGRGHAGRYIVFARLVEGRFTTNCCDLTRPVERAGAILRLLNEEPPEPEDLLPVSKYEELMWARWKERTCWVPEETLAPPTPEFYDIKNSLSWNEQTDLVGKLRERLWELWMERKPADGVSAIFYTIEGDPTHYEFSVKKDRDGRSLMHVQMCSVVAALLPKGERPRHYSQIGKYSELTRIDSASGAVVPVGEVRSPQTYRLKFGTGSDKPDLTI